MESSKLIATACIARRVFHNLLRSISSRPLQRYVAFLHPRNDIVITAAIFCKFDID